MTGRKQQDSGASGQTAHARHHARGSAPCLVALIRKMILELHLLLWTERAVGRVVVVRRVLLRGALRVKGGASGHRGNREQSDRVARGEVWLPVIHPRASCFDALDARGNRFVYRRNAPLCSVLSVHLMRYDSFNLLVNESPRSSVQGVAEDSIKLTAYAYFHFRFASARGYEPAESVR